MRRYVPLLIIGFALVAYELSGPVAERLRREPQAETPPAQAPGPGEAHVEPPVSATADVEGKISRGTPFFVEMKRAGLSPVDIHNIVESSKPLFNFRRVMPGQRFAIFKGGDATVDSLHFVINDERTLTVVRAGEQFASRIDTVAYRVEHRATSGTINSSIYETLQASGANPELASLLAIIFQWDIDFFIDIRRGDSFSILYEEKVYESGRSQLGPVLAARVFTRGDDHYAFAYSTDKGVHYYDENGKSLQKSLLRAPLRFSRVSSSFSYRRLHPVHKRYKPHLGVDYAAPHGTPVHSTGDGTVVAAAYASGNGRYVKIRHNSRYTTYYLHLSRFARGIRRGVHVRQGQVIGYVGATGIATGPHLDYRIKVGGRFVNPRTIKLPSKEPVPKDELPFFACVRDAYLVKLFEGSLVEETVAVEEPISPMQMRLSGVF